MTQRYRVSKSSGHQKKN